MRRRVFLSGAILTGAGVPLLAGCCLIGAVSMLLLALQERRSQRTFEGVVVGLLVVVTIGFVGGLVGAEGGGGSLAIIAAHYLPDSEVVASDISADALQLATENIADYGLENRIRLVQGDLFQNLQGESFKLILCNPPYVNADSMAALPSEYRAEPEKALGSGPDGMDLITRLLHEAPDHLWPCGVLALEIGHEMPNFQARFPTLTWTSIPVAQGDDRIVLITADDLRQWREQQQG